MPSAQCTARPPVHINKDNISLCHAKVLFRVRTKQNLQVQLAQSLICVNCGAVRTAIGHQHLVQLPAMAVKCRLNRHERG